MMIIVINVYIYMGYGKYMSDIENIKGQVFILVR